jgi:hypothetical protein
MNDMIERIQWRINTLNEMLTEAKLERFKSDFVEGMNKGKIVRLEGEIIFLNALLKEEQVNT